MQKFVALMNTFVIAWTIVTAIAVLNRDMYQVSVAASGSKFECLSLARACAEAHVIVTFTFNVCAFSINCPPPLPPVHHALSLNPPLPLPI
jgi:hypothetical protein